jgi:hypothetical protein
MRQAKTPALGLCWDSFQVRQACPVGMRTGHSRRAASQEIPNVPAEQILTLIRRSVNELRFQDTRGRP